MTTYKLTAIVSGGQAGADRGALQAAIDLGLGWGGWSPAGWRSEDGEIPAVYRERMKCTTSSDYGMRTRLNVQDSDGTLLISFDPEISGGSAFTEKTVKSQRKPYLHLVLPDRGNAELPAEVRAGVLEWISDCRISVLNVAGPRESKAPGIQEAVRDTLVWIFEPEAADDAPAPTAEEQATAQEIATEVTQLIGSPPSASPDPEVTAIMDVVREIVDAAPKVGDVIRTLPDGTPVRWGGGQRMEASQGDPNAFDPDPVAILHRVDPPRAVAPDIFEQALKLASDNDDGISVRIRGHANFVAAGPNAVLDMSHLSDEEWAEFVKEGERIADEDAERNFIANCENIVTLLPTVTPELVSGALVEVKALINLFYEFPNNGAGGSLHIVLDDNNIGRDSIEYCLTYARREGDACGEALAKLLLALTDEQIEALLDPRPETP